MLTLDILKKRSRQESLTAGQKLYKNHKVQNPEMMKQEGPDQSIWSAKVQGAFGAPRPVTLSLNEADEAVIAGYTCTCFDSQNAEGLCQHAVALALWVIDDFLQPEAEQENPEAGKPVISEENQQVLTEAAPADPVQPVVYEDDSARVWRRTTHGLSNYMASRKAVTDNLQAGIQPGSVRLEPELSISWDETDGLILAAGLHIGISRMYTVKNIPNFVHAVLIGETVSYGKGLSFAHSTEMFQEQAFRLFTILEHAVRKQYPAINAARVPDDAPMKQIAVSEEEFCSILNLCLGQTITINRKASQISDTDPHLIGSLVRNSDQGANMQLPTVMAIAGNDGTWIYSTDAINRVSDTFLTNAMPFLYALNAVNVKNSMAMEFLSRSDFEKFCGDILPGIEPYITFEEKNFSLETYKPQPVKFEFYLTADKEGVLWMRPLACYGAKAYPLFVSGSEYRNLHREIPARELVKQYFDPSDEPELFSQADEAKIYEFLTEGTDAFRHEGALLYDRKPEKQIGIAQTPKLSVGVKKKSNLIDLSVESEELSKEELEKLLTACAEKKKYFRLKNGEYLELEDGVFKVITNLAEGLGLEGGELTDAEVPLYRAGFVNDVLTDAVNNIEGTGEDGSPLLEVETSPDFDSLIQNLQSFNDSGIAVPEDITVTLRPYQEEGFRWLATMAECGLGCILADDMGLGKTLQTITLIDYKKVKTLIVSPASLLYNWGNEIRKFAPDLSVELIRGRAALREDLILHSEAQVFVTSYDYLKRDIEKYEGLQFGMIVIDEAQEIRNPGTQTARAVKLVQAELHIALTGTPIENNLTDLWSIFDYIMPGYLFGQKKFHTEYELPIANEDEDKLDQLRRMVQPFMLRRKKEDVLQDLPDKVENIFYVDLAEEQRLLYLHEEQLLRESLTASSEDDLKRNKLEFLARLNNLRQYCCDPHLHLEGYEGASGKVDACMDMLKQAREGNHHVLVFSQFTSMLEILQEKAEEEGMTTLYLQGKDSKEDRQRMVEQFQTGNYTVFFISLKAGGTGLTLTAADQVIHFDPWWNSAAEDQATGRAHRFGQKNTVFVTKLVAKDTIEERIVEMQEQKRDLSNSIISGGEISSGAMNRDELLTLLGQER